MHELYHCPLQLHSASQQFLKVEVADNSELRHFPLAHLDMRDPDDLSASYMSSHMRNAKGTRGRQVQHILTYLHSVWGLDCLCAIGIPCSMLCMVCVLSPRTQLRTYVCAYPEHTYVHVYKGKGHLCCYSRLQQLLSLAVGQGRAKSCPSPSSSCRVLPQPQRGVLPQRRHPAINSLEDTHAPCPSSHSFSWWPDCWRGIHAILFW